MPYRSARSIPAIAAVTLLAAASMLSGCEDPLGMLGEPLIATAEVEIAAPRPERSEIPSAIDVMALQGIVGGARFPESAAHATHWDVTLRERDGDLLLVTPSDTLIGMESRAALAPAITDRSFEEVREAPAERVSRTRTLPVREGHVYVVRSRRESGCEQFSKMTPLELDLEEGRVVFRILTNGRCGDVRLHVDD